MAKNLWKHRLAVIIGTLLITSGPALAEAPAADAAQEELFLDLLPSIDVPEHVRAIPGAVNEEFRNCETFWPDGYEHAQSGPEARAMRDVYGLVRTRNVIATQDCSCVGKVASWPDVEILADAIRKQSGVSQLSWQQTKAIAKEANRLTVVAETMCGGKF